MHHDREALFKPKSLDGDKSAFLLSIGSLSRTAVTTGVQKVPYIRFRSLRKNTPNDDGE